MSSTGSHVVNNEKGKKLDTTRLNNRAGINNHGGGNDNNIKVYVRCRSRTQREIDEKSSVVISTMGLNGNKVILNNNNTSTHSSSSSSKKTYTFDRVFGVESDQEVLFNSVANNYILEMLQGYNCTVFAYGQTGTGKTYTMSGDLNILGDLESQDKILLGEHAGIIPRVLVELFKQLTTEDNSEYSVKVSFLELYNEKLKDLLSNYNADNNSNGSKSTNINSNGNNHNKNNNNNNNNNNNGGNSNHQSNSSLNNNNMHSNNINNNNNGHGLTINNINNNGSSIMVKGMEEIYIKSAHEGLKLLMEGSLKRKVASTKLNDLSSRSHTIFTIITNITKVDPITGKKFVKTGKLNLVDLAGSENINRSGAENKRAQEAGLINKSLLTLGRVINALVDYSQHIPYRESKLTRLLQDSLGGKTKTCIIATISPAKISMEETVSTLEYATRAKSIKNTPQINQSLSKDTFMHEYIHEIDRLRNELKASRQKDGIYITQDQLELYESNSILITEQKAKIDNMEDQIKRFKAKYVEQTALNKTLEIKLKKNEILSNELQNQKDLIFSVFKEYQSNCNEFIEKISNIHSSNLDVIGLLDLERLNLYESSVTNINTLQLIVGNVTKQINELSTINLNLESYTINFNNTSSRVFNEMENAFIDIETSIKSGLNSIQIDRTLEKIRELQFKTDKILSTLTNTEWEDDTSSVYKVHLVTLAECFNEINSSCSSIELALSSHIGTVRNSISTTFQNLEDVGNVATSNLIQVIKNQSVEIQQLETQLQREREAIKKSDEHLGYMQTYYQEHISKSRRKMFENIFNVIEESERNNTELDNEMLRQTSKTLNYIHDEYQTSGKALLEKLTKKSLISLSKANDVANTFSNKLKTISDESSKKIIDDIMGIPIKDSISSILNVAKLATDESKSTPIFNLGNELNSKFKSFLNFNSQGIENNITTAVKLITEDHQKNKKHINTAYSHIDKLSQYMLTDYKGNFNQICNTQQDLMLEKTSKVNQVIESLQNISGKQTILPYPVLKLDSDGSTKKELPILEKPKNFEIYRDMEEHSTEEGIGNSPKYLQSLISTNIIPSTPVPVPDHPLPKVLVPKNINSSTKRSKTLPSSLIEKGVTSSNNNNLKRRFTTESVVQEDHCNVHMSMENELNIHKRIHSENIDQ